VEKEAYEKVEEEKKEDEREIQVNRLPLPFPSSLPPFFNLNINLTFHNPNTNLATLLPHPFAPIN